METLYLGPQVTADQRFQSSEKKLSWDQCMLHKYVHTEQRRKATSFQKFKPRDVNILGCNTVRSET